MASLIDIILVASLKSCELHITLNAIVDSLLIQMQ